MASFHAMIHPVHERRGLTVQALALLTDEQVTTSVEGGGDVRYCLWRMVITANQQRVDLARTLAGLGWQQTEAQRILALTLESRGDLRSILLGVPDEYIDMEPAPGEWSARQALEHAHSVDRRYMEATQYAVERIHSNQDLPVQRPSDGQPRSEDERLSGRLAEVLARLQRRREEVVAGLSSLSDDELAAPAIYRREQVDLRYRLYLFSAHEREHTGQVARTLRAVGFQQSEAQMILGQLEQEHGATDGMLIGIPNEVATRRPPGALPSIQDILTRASDEEQALSAKIQATVGS